MSDQACGSVRLPQRTPVSGQFNWLLSLTCKACRNSLWILSNSKPHVLINNTCANSIYVSNLHPELDQQSHRTDSHGSSKVINSVIQSDSHGSFSHSKSVILQSFKVTAMALRKGLRAGPASGPGCAGEADAARRREKDICFSLSLSLALSLSLSIYLSLSLALYLSLSLYIYIYICHMSYVYIYIYIYVYIHTMCV